MNFRTNALAVILNYPRGLMKNFNIAFFKLESNIVYVMFLELKLIVLRNKLIYDNQI